MRRLSSKDVELIKRLADVTNAAAALASERKFLRDQLEDRLDLFISDNATNSAMQFDEHGKIRVVASTGELVEITRSTRTSVPWRTVAYSLMPLIPEERIRELAEEYSVESTFTSAEVVDHD